MAKNKTPNQNKDKQSPPDLFEMARQGQEAFAEILKSTTATATAAFDPLNLTGSFVEASKSLASDPSKLVQANLDLWQEHMKLWQHATQRLAGEESEPVATPEKGDRRFKHARWSEDQMFDLIKQSYLITSRWLLNTMENLTDLDKKDAQKVSFYTRQFVDAFSPSNFALTNPEVLEATLNSKGENLVRGMDNLKRDIAEGGGNLKIAMTDKDAFEVGVNLATTPGQVVYQNEIMQLIQYEPSTKKVRKRPLLIVPPWINKYYILDLKPENSFVKWIVDQGYTVFLVSWANPDESLAEKTFEDYMQQGIIDACDAIEKATGCDEMTAIGYCIGGTLMAATLAYMAAIGDERIKAVTFFTAQVDFSEPGDLGVFIDEHQLDSLDKRMAEKGYLEAGDMYTTFNMLRSNDLIWSFYVNNYLLGKDPLQFDLLYWNGDSTNMPRETHMYYLRECYLHNNLVKPGALVLKGVPIDLSKINIPVYLQSSKEDHIAPYHSVFKLRKNVSGPVRFMLAGSGHIAGVVNHPDANKYQYWINEDQPDNLDEWIEGAEEHPGSWWPDWNKWLAKQSGAKKTEARKPGDGKLKPIEAAPGSFVKA
ncbi:MAG: class I poly(R)-hydroxyalkanoic acid synthase [Xanthomonadales bacterium]|nr:class I poly(R)-hydroxyalkanoic acid synthase [Xanthomonadales bacterium]